MISSVDQQEHNDDTDCYVDGHWGIYGLGHMADQFRGFVTDNEYEVLSDVDADLDIRYDIADKVEERINAALPEGKIAHWMDGEFFISPYCGSECGDEECYCHVF